MAATDAWSIIAGLMQISGRLVHGRLRGRLEDDRYKKVNHEPIDPARTLSIYSSLSAACSPCACRHSRTPSQALVSIRQEGHRPRPLPSMARGSSTCLFERSESNLCWNSSRCRKISFSSSTSAPSEDQIRGDMAPHSRFLPTRPIFVA